MLELLIIGIDGELLVSGSELLGSALALSLDKKNSNVHDQLSFSLLHMLIVYTEKFWMSKCGGRGAIAPPLPSACLWLNTPMPAASIRAVILSSCKSRIEI